jgi:acetate kinase
VRVLVVNAGSSSLKVRLLDPDDALVREPDLPPPRPGEDNADLVDPLGGVGPVDAVGHRIVHGQRSEKPSSSTPAWSPNSMP